MKAAVLTAYGPPESVRIVQMAIPEASAGDVLVRVRASTVNRTDVGYRAGTPHIIRVFAGLRRPKYQVLGTEFAGTVEAVGDGVTSFAPGDRVCGYNEKTFGAHAEYMTIAADGSITTIPGELDFGEVAPSFEGSHYALANLRAGKVGDDTDLLVYGATGAIGSAAVQLAKALGAHVTAVCGTAHVKLVEGLGADRIIDYQTEDFRAHGATYDVVFDAVGKSTFAACKPLLRPNGLSRHRHGAISLESTAGVDHQSRSWPTGQVPIAQRQPGNRPIPARPHRSRRVPPGHRPDLPAR